MKNWIIIGGSFILLIFLGIRGIYKTIYRVDDEKKWYVSQMKLNCTLQIDSIATYTKSGVGNLYCDLISGEIDPSLEFRLNKKLRHHKQISFLIWRLDRRYIIFSRRASKYLKGDSLTVDSDSDQITFYRDGKEFWKAKVTNSLREKIF